MDWDLSKIPYSRQDFAAGITLPKKMDSLLAYETGVHIGDGNLSIEKYSDSTKYTSTYCGSAIDEIPYYKEILLPIVKKLYNKGTFFIGQKNTCYVRVQSKAVAYFKKDILNLPVGSKQNLTGIPEEIATSNDFLKHFIRGLTDTDFSICFLKRYTDKQYYPRISLQTANVHLVRELKEILNSEFGIKSTTVENKVHYHSKTQKVFIGSYLQINGKDNLDKWLKTFGCWNLKYLARIHLWRKYGYLPRDNALLIKTMENKEELLKQQIYKMPRWLRGRASDTADSSMSANPW